MTWLGVLFRRETRDPRGKRESTEREREKEHRKRKREPAGLQFFPYTLLKPFSSRKTFLTILLPFCFLHLFCRVHFHVFLFTNPLIFSSLSLFSLSLSHLSSPNRLCLFVCSTNFLSREGRHWSERRKSLNRVFLKQKTISSFSTVFNDVISDLLKRWTLVAENTCPSGTHSSCDPSTDDSSALVTKIQSHQLCNLERELYNWSIECEWNIFSLSSPLSSSHFRFIQDNVHFFHRKMLSMFLSVCNQNSSFCDRERKFVKWEEKVMERKSEKEGRVEEKSFDHSRDVDD